MTIPAEPLKITLDPNVATLGDMAYLETEGKYPFTDLVEFLVRNSNWTKKQIKAIAISEAGEVNRMITESLQASAVPKETSSG